MRLEHYSQEKLKKEILSILTKRLDLKKYKVFFFGSRVSGGGTDRSDVDIGIEGQEHIPAKVIWEIEEDIENLPTLYKLEIVDFADVAEKFKSVALKSIEVIA
ncbi:hypothetical protein A3G55_03750 [Candidatus Giovannonibacteria bacterium RIFCSPLOWO2_12_FULL_44_25]|uniref:Polymerase beta nucleotidyltransferase domain-containing protein n=2 Tax=Candidatus Giovannoniibacteriota TaxID=1752738 RepID=A0A1F5W9Q5_9BACT|nr:MAG: polymerase beta domain protein region protein [Parcubacteria group bacterium GW2011_GWC1_44_10]KKT60353.1 MAG: polymerase beta domain protein region protein [Candidatus Giovannonibacteria bacterium GW2011_GWA1_44_25]KKU29447.1 MAG: polymerase beta domain protein region protein [Candidatus Giovannonibacteria bacterium GW2011_GWB1_46_20]OGF50422.1 MAG: hypothetical protein A2120_02135 [Candidatus Giovannonibacteria bacterium GWA2_45_15]OGF59144.1 MAG: hypothetical protein A2W40_02395 [Can